MNSIDLSQQLFDHMPVYPGDPEVLIQKIHTIKTEGWNIQNITFTSHTGTHINMPIHMTENGKTLDDYSLDNFYGPCELYSEKTKLNRNTGIIFVSQNIDKYVAEILIQNPPKFVGLSEKFEFDNELEKLLLAHEILSYENLTNCDKLTEKFMFYGFPLNIKEGDGSPVRAVAILS